ncbi:type II secretion system F family protein [Candidatus Micrarchaeota archaeon]|nr:type II secretion system F family protein [Candidatus Micrarchaeota archaeon]
MPDDKLKRLSETVRKEPTSEGVERIISKLRPKDEETIVESKTPLDFRKVDFEDGKGIVSAIGKFYSFLEAPLEGLASFLSNFPAVRSLDRNLKAAGMHFNTETYLIIASATSLFLALVCFIVLATVSISINDQVSFFINPVVSLVVFLVAAVVILVYPSSKASERAAQVDKALPFALRQLATQLKAGLSFYKSLSSLAKSEYGLLSKELEIVLRDLDSGLSTEEALRLLTQRVKSEGLHKAVLQIIRAMKTGGNLSVVISEIADDVSFETRQQIRDFTEKLNLVSILYIMLGIVMPVVVAILSAVLQIPLFAGTIPSWFVYAGFGMSIVFMILIVYITRKMEPAAW